MKGLIAALFVGMMILGGCATHKAHCRKNTKIVIVKENMMMEQVHEIEYPCDPPAKPKKDANK